MKLSTLSTAKLKLDHDIEFDLANADDLISAHTIFELQRIRKFLGMIVFFLYCPAVIATIIFLIRLSEIGRVFKQ
jgi:hypothetical protein